MKTDEKVVRYFEKSKYFFFLTFFLAIEFKVRDNTFPQSIDSREKSITIDVAVLMGVVPVSGLLEISNSKEK